MRNLPAKYHLTDATMEILNNEEFDRDILAVATRQDLKDMGIKVSQIVNIIAWQESLARQSPNTVAWLKSSKSPNKTRKTPNKSPNNSPPTLFRHATISDTLLSELVGNDGLRRAMDAVMFTGTEGAKLGKHTLHLTPYTTLAGKSLIHHYSDIKWHANTLYYNWTTMDGTTVRPFCHLSLKNDDLHTNRNGFDRDVIGRFHLRWDYLGKHPVRRILVNDNQGVIELTRCSMKDQDIDAMTELVLHCIQVYYIQTRGACNIVPGRC